MWLRLVVVLYAGLAVWFAGRAWQRLLDTRMAEGGAIYSMILALTAGMNWLLFLMLEMLFSVPPPWKMWRL